MNLVGCCLVEMVIFSSHVLKELRAKVLCEVYIFSAGLYFNEVIETVKIL